MNTIQAVQQLEALANGLANLTKEGKLSDNELEQINDSIKRTIKQAKVVSDAFEKPLKKALEFQTEIIIGSRKYYFKKTQSKVLDTKKVKDTLKELNYSLDDFYTLQTRKSLVWDIEKND